ncbi:hypothetical protein SAMN05216570_1410 [Dyella sp. OK004]|uniref:hypothetical protein n=1 Tax=Dyella sp. OK004 TaxID=1855292 RepID=UPI0008E96C1B|nr:hypothetical protein [Dyella sp. OK004]SFS00227.1 hypothetical protein SAMN05216570_1410 [Dyella sp. OK004]
MTSISGKTTNGFTYEGDYEHTGADRVTWAATYRRSGIFFGMRHGRINELLGVPAGEVNEAVQDDIEFAWVPSTPASGRPRTSIELPERGHLPGIQ